METRRRPATQAVKATLQRPALCSQDKVNLLVEERIAI
jgi:hypothetical protein